MSSAVAVVGLTYRSTDIQLLDSIFLEIVRGLAEVPNVRGVDLTVPSRAGKSVRNRVADRLPIELRGIVRGSGADETAQRTSFATNRAAFRALFSPSLDPGSLVATLEDGTIKTIAARTVNYLPTQLVPTLMKVSIELESVDPDWA